MMAGVAEPRKGRTLARLLRPFATVEPEESASVAVLALTVFLVLTGYYLLKTAREPLILLHGGAEVKSYAAAGQSLLLVVVARVYSAIARRVGRLRLLSIIYLFFASNLVVFAVLARAGASIGVAFYLWVGVFSVTAIAQFWSFAADVYTPEQGKRLFAILGIGGSVGAVVGGRFAKELVALGPAGLMLAAAAILVICLLLIALADRRLLPRAPAARPGRNEAPLISDNAFRVLAKDKYLILIAALMLVVNWVNTNGEYLLDRTLLAQMGRLEGAEAERFVGSFKAEYFSWVNLAGVVLQLFVVSRILTKLGVRNALLFLPVVAFGSYSVMLAAPVLALIRLGKIGENSLDYSVQSTARQALFLVTSPVEKFVGKQVVDTLFMRLGDVLSAMTVWAGTRLAVPMQGYAALNLGLVAVWIAVVFAIGREHARRSSEAPGVRLAEPVAA
jgi:AAA family ATP:ADP antiporter